MTRFVAIVLTRNEAHNISDCVAALRGWCDAVIVWDSGSTDATQQIAYLAGAQVVERPWDNFAAQRQAALDSISADWVLFVDADERIPEPLRDEILAIVRPEQAELSNPVIHGFWIARRNFIAGKETRGGGFWPDYQLRLLERDFVRYDPAREVHEIVEVEGETGHLREPMIHLNYLSWKQFHKKQPEYARYEARILKARGIKPRPHNFVLQPLREFWRRYVSLKGYKDGIHGLRLAFWLSYYYGFVPYWDLLRKRV